MLLPIGDVCPRERVPYVNYALIGVNAAAYFLLGLQPDYERTVALHGLTPAQPQALDYLTSIFLHADPFHLAGNMLFLWICGDNVEDRLGPFGYLVFYLACGFAASQTHVWFTAGRYPEAEIPTIGASGAISGVLGAYVVMFPNSFIKIWYFFGFLWSGVFYTRSLWAIGFWFGEQLLLGTLDEGSNVAYWAHIGGFVVGAAAAVLFIGTGLVEKPPAQRRPEAYRRYYS